VPDPLLDERRAHGVGEDARAAPEAQALLHRGPSSSSSGARRGRRLRHQQRCVLAAVLQQQAAGRQAGL
jgi:hypothetical protein